MVLRNKGENMSEIIQLCYIATIFIGVSAWSMQLLTRRKNLAATNRLVKSRYTTLFLALVVTFNVCDFLVLFLNSWLGTAAVSWVLVAENVLEITLAYVLIEMEREYFALKENKSRFVFFTLVIAAALWIDVAYTVNIMPLSEACYIRLMLGLNLLPVVALVVFTLRNLRKIFHAGRSLAGGYFLLYNIVFFLLCSMMTISILDSRTAKDYVGNDREIYLLFWLIFNVLNYILIWRSCQSVGVDGSVENSASAASEITPEELVLQAKIRYGLSDREAEIARLIYKGKNNNDIASDLFVSPNTVKVHTSNLYRKLGVKSRVQAVQVLRGETIDTDQIS